VTWTKGQSGSPEHQFKPGQSGNPAGRPKGASLIDMLRRVLEREHQGRPVGELLVECLVKEGLKGKLPHIKEILDRVEGKVAEKMSVEGVRYGGSYILPIPEAKPTGNPEVDRLLREARAEQVKAGVAQAPPDSKVVIGECWLNL
jgi:uncharacterized protein DUF5681